MRTARTVGLAVSRCAPAQCIARAVARVLDKDDHRRAAEALGEPIRDDSTGTAPFDELKAGAPASGRTNLFVQ
jgi:hypothetical protein